MRTISAAILALAGVGTALALSDQPILFTANLSTNQVTHKLFAVGDKSAPKPFYKRCTTPIGKPDAYKKAATGQGVFWFNPKTNVLKYAFTYNGMSGSAVMAHFHIGKAGRGGPIVQTICGMPPPNSKNLGYSAPAISAKTCHTGTSGFLSGSYQLRGNMHDDGMTLDQEKQALMNGELYINIHTCLNQAGELRGQIKRVTAG